MRTDWRSSLVVKIRRRGSRNSCQHSAANAILQKGRRLVDMRSYAQQPCFAGAVDGIQTRTPKTRFDSSQRPWQPIRKRRVPSPARTVRHEGINESTRKLPRTQQRNAPMKSFWTSRKKEPVHRQHYQTRDEARADIFDYIKCFYNTIRRHSALGNQSPLDFTQSIVSDLKRNQI